MKTLVVSTAMIALLVPSVHRNFVASAETLARKAG